MGRRAFIALYHPLSLRDQVGPVVIHVVIHIIIVDFIIVHPEELTSRIVAKPVAVIFGNGAISPLDVHGIEIDHFKR